MKKAWIVFILGLSASVYGADFPTGAQLEIMSDFSGGLNTASPSQKITHNFSPNMRNVFTHRQPGKIVKRSGFITLGSTNTLQRGSYGIPFYHTDGSKDFLVSDSSMMLQTKDFQSYVFVSSNTNFNSNFDCTEAGYTMYCTNGVDPVFTWDGTNKVLMDGTKGNPNIPKGKYIEYFLNRIWVGNTAIDPSSLDWSAVVSTNGTIIAPNNFLAWPSLNHHSVGGGDGEALNALFVYKGQLQIGKDLSIYTEYGDRDSNFIDRKTIANAGVTSNDSVVNLDGVIYYKSKNGVYAYDGYQATRISDLIKPDIDSMQDPNSRVLANLWETQADFSRGLFFGTTVTASGFIMPITGVRNYATQAGGATYSRLSPSTTFFNLTQLVSTESFNTNVVYNIAYWHFTPIYSGDQSVSPQVNCIVRNTSTGEEASFVLPSKGDGNFTLNFTGAYFEAFQTPCGIYNCINSSIVFTASQLNNDTLSVKLVLLNPSSTTADYVDFPQSDPRASTLVFVPQTTTYFISDISTETTITAWGNFNSVRNTNSQIIKYQIRSSTSLVNISTKIWSDISPGAIIGEPIINRFIQWQATFTSISSYTAITVPNIDNVEIDHIEGGGAANRVLATDWNNEYWMSVSTDLTSSLRLQYVKSWVTNATPNAWNVLSGQNIGCLWHDGAIALYAGDSSTGTFYRLDYGTNDNGTAIDAFYETPEITLKGFLTGGYDGNWLEEQLVEYWIDADAQNGNTFRLATSLDGKAYTEQTVDLSGSSRILKTLYTPNNFAKYFKWRFRNNDLDKMLGLNSFAVLYVPMKTR